MTDNIAASSKDILELTKSIGENIKKINSLNEDLSQKLDRLGETFQDEGYNIIQGYVANSQNKINDAIPDIRIIMEKLIEYAQLLKESEKAFNDGV